MSEVKQNLKDVIEVTMIPEVEDYLNDLHTLLEENKATDDDMDAIREMESFLVELQNIILVIEEDKLDDEQDSDVYQNILNMIEESKEH
ncbi:MAG: hypothetical protein C0625_01930 [Arcobacter sp.]|nr:MAG: hypothetical protein C0625_01930 [Arcobacter sp.]